MFLAIKFAQEKRRGIITMTVTRRPIAKHTILEDGGNYSRVDHALAIAPVPIATVERGHYCSMPQLNMQVRNLNPTSVLNYNLRTQLEHIEITCTAY